MKIALRESTGSRMIIDNTLDNETAWEALLGGNRNDKRILFYHAKCCHFAR